MLSFTEIWPDEPVYGNGRENAYTTGTRFNPEVEEAFEQNRARHLAKVTGEVWVVVSAVHPKGGYRLWTYNKKTLEECPLSVPFTILYTAAPEEEGE